VRDVATQQDRPDHLKWIKFSSAAWTHDGAGFFYSRYPEPAAGADPLLEVITTRRFITTSSAPSSPPTRLCLRTARSSRLGLRGRSERRRTLRRVHGLAGHRPPQSHLLSRPGRRQASAARRTCHPLARCLRRRPTASSANTGPSFYFQTDNGAPRGRIVAVDVRHPAPGAWKEIVPQAPDVIEGSADRPQHLCRALPPRTPYSQLRPLCARR